MRRARCFARCGQAHRVSQARAKAGALPHAPMLPNDTPKRARLLLSWFQAALSILAVLGPTTTVMTPGASACAPQPTTQRKTQQARECKEPPAALHGGQEEGEIRKSSQFALQRQSPHLTPLPQRNANHTHNSNTTRAEQPAAAMHPRRSALPCRYLCSTGATAVAAWPAQPQSVARLTAPAPPKPRSQRGAVPAGVSGAQRRKSRGGLLVGSASRRAQEPPGGGQAQGAAQRTC